MLKPESYIYMLGHTSTTYYGITILTHLKEYSQEEFTTMYQKALSETGVLLAEDLIESGTEEFQILFRDMSAEAVEYMIDEYGFMLVEYDSKVILSSPELVYCTKGSHKGIPTSTLIRNVADDIENSINGEIEY